VAVVRTEKSDQKGRVAIPFILWMAGVPLMLVIVLWFLFFRGS